MKFHQISSNFNKKTRFFACFLPVFASFFAYKKQAKKTRKGAF